jgi:DNA-binding MarR family transcriptional regulator
MHPLLSDRVRLSIMGVVASSDVPVSFNDLLESLGLSKGNLSAHMKKLEDEKFVNVEKKFVDRKPRTTYACTESGRHALKEYLSAVQKMLASAG